MSQLRLERYSFNRIKQKLEIVRAITDQNRRGYISVVADIVCHIETIIASSSADSKTIVSQRIGYADLFSVVIQRSTVEIKSEIVIVGSAVNYNFVVLSCEA